MKNVLLFSILLFGFASCQDEIDISNRLNSGEIQLAVDAFLHSDTNTQTIKLTTTQYFYDNTSPKPAIGALVSLTDIDFQKVYSFSESRSGMYTCKGPDSMLVIGHRYRLDIHYSGEDYHAYSQMNRVVPIDTIKFEHNKDATGKELEDYVAEFFATDAPGVGDRYWIRYYHNRVRDTTVSNIGIAYDASIGANGTADDEVFILPLRRQYINNFDNKWYDGDNIRVELYSITDSTANFLSQLSTQSDIGNNGALGALFSPPIANIPSNITNVNPKGKKAVGWFCVSAATSQSTIVPNPWKR
jgi:hypothetical protein